MFDLEFGRDGFAGEQSAVGWLIGYSINGAHCVYNESIQQITGKQGIIVVSQCLAFMLIIEDCKLKLAAPLPCRSSLTSRPQSHDR